MALDGLLRGQLFSQGFRPVFRPELKRHERLYEPFYLRLSVYIQSAEWFFRQSPVLHFLQYACRMSLMHIL